jgi:uroporphyrinogen decarboxylase
LTATRNDLLLRALLRQPTPYTPVWLMRQAGRYLPEYRATRARAGSFHALCTTPDYACEVTLQPLARYPLDAAILFSDILMLPQAMGHKVEFESGEGPKVASPVRSAAAASQLPVPDPESDLRPVMDAVRLIRRELAGRVPLIGFAGSPWTVSTYMVEGGTSKTFSVIKGMAYAEPKVLEVLLDRLTRATVLYLNAQIAAGAQAVMLFDTWGGILSPDLYRRYSLAPMAEVVAGLDREHQGERIPVILFTKGGGAWLAEQAATGADALGIDWTTDLGTARAQLGARVALQGNLDPSALYAPPATLRSEAARVLKSYGDGPGHVFNLGHGILPDVDPEQVGRLISAVHELSARA